MPRPPPESNGDSDTENTDVPGTSTWHALIPTVSTKRARTQRFGFPTTFEEVKELVDRANALAEDHQRLKKLMKGSTKKRKARAPASIDAAIIDAELQERRARTLREWDALKDEITGTPKTWGVNPRTRKLYEKRPQRTPPEMQKARDAHEAHKHEMKSTPEHKHDYKTRFATSSRTSWRDKHARFVTQLHEIPGRAETMYIHSHTWADALRADAAAVACANAHNSLNTQRAQKKQRLAANAPKRAADMVKHGDNCALERRELLRLRDHVHRVTEGGVRVQICPDGCWADALFRTADMRAGQWLAWQHKSTAEMHTDEKKGSTFWLFNKVLGYTHALVVCSDEEEPDRVWVLHGKVLDDHGVRDMKVTKSKKKGILPVPADGKTLPTNLDGLVAALQRECAKVVAEDATALRTCTVEEVDARVGQNHAVERAGVLAWCACKHGEPVPWLEMPLAMRDDDRNLRLLRKVVNGTVVETVLAYPESQNGKVDVEVLHEWKNTQNDRKTTYQFKTPEERKGQTGFQVNLETAAGKDEAGTQLYLNTYKRGDNDVYVIVIPDKKSSLAREGHVDVWEIPESALGDKGLLGTADAPPPAGTAGFVIHRKGSTANAPKHGWTREYHQAFVATEAYGWLEGDDAAGAEGKERLARFKLQQEASLRGVKRAREDECAEPDSE